MEPPNISRSESQEIQIFVKSLLGIRLIIKIDHNATLMELKAKIKDETGIPSHQMKLIFASKPMSDYVGTTDTPKTLRAHNIQKGSTVHLVQKFLNDAFSRELTRLPSSANATTSHQQRAEAVAGDFDEDLYIVDPHSHFELLKRLERDVVQRSEYYNNRRVYSVSTIIDPKDDDGAFLNQIRLRPYLHKIILESSIARQTLQEQNPSLHTFWHLLKSYSIILNASRSLEQMASLQFCKDAISILLAHQGTDVIEIKRIPAHLITDIEKSLEEAMFEVHYYLNKRNLMIILTGLVRGPFRSFLYHLGVRILSPLCLGLKRSLMIIRKVALLLDIALVSYVRSHGSGFDTTYFGGDLNSLDVSDEHDLLTFRCSWARLACLNDFLDKRRLWVFNFSHGHTDSPPPGDENQASRSKSVLARMKDFADIWGPVYTVPASAGLVKYYVVSKGVICKVNDVEQSPFAGAVQCHYYSRLSFCRRKASRLLSGTRDLTLSNDDLLLIGAGFRENPSCQFTTSAFAKEVASTTTLLGTKESVWRTDSRSLAIGFSKHLGVTVTGTQKLIPQTTLKQHILDKWTTIPARSNPGILNQYLGVEISQCTGNARRISLRKLMISTPIKSILERQIPNWAQTSWGSALYAALSSADNEDIFHFWKEFASNRSDVAELVCCVLELLDGTGWNEQEMFHSALLIDNKEWAVSVAKNLNNWLIVLRDTHLTGAYVVSKEVCIECEVPDHSTSTCEIPQGFTVLQTQFATTEHHWSHYTDLLLKPFGERLRQVVYGDSDLIVFTPNSGHSRVLEILTRGKSCECCELLNQTNSYSTRNMIYLRASIRSRHGKHEIKGSIAARLLGGRESQYRFSTTQHQGINGRTATAAASNQLNDTPDHSGRLGPPQWNTVKVTYNMPVGDAQSQQSFMSPAQPTPSERSDSIQAGKWLKEDRTHSDSRYNEYHSKAPAESPISALKARMADAEGEDLIKSDICGQDSYDFGSLQGRPPTRVHGKRLGALRMGHEIDVTPVNGLQEDLANYTFSDHDESADENEATRHVYMPSAEGSRI
ncbi:MAG: hypothetical protein Q9166_004023 [cf. Caloplaca sp. 2 TL-2023]